MPNSIRQGKVFHCGSRGKRKAHGANNENSEEESEEEEGLCY